MKNEPIDLTSDDIILLESLVKSPVFSALKRALLKYRDVCYGELLTAHEPSKLYQLQGRIIGVNVIENLPGILIQSQHEKEARQKKAQQAQEELQARKARIFDPSLPPVKKI